MTATVSFRHPGGTPGTFDPDTGKTPVVPYPPYYTGPSRIQAMSTTAQQALSAEEQIARLSYLVTVPWDGAGGPDDFAVDDLAHVDAVDANGDPTLVDRELTLTSVVRGSLTFERDLICTDELG